MNDLSSKTHNDLDKEFTSNQLIHNATVELHGAAILCFLFTPPCMAAYADIWPVDDTKINQTACDNLLASRPDIQSLLRTAHADGKYAKIRNLPEFHQKRKKIFSGHFIDEERRALTEKLLHHAYTQPFRGENATQFLDYLLDIDASVRGGQVIYAKSVSIVQSSGTGKSRMLTEIGRQIFTLPICLRGPRDRGYPPGDRFAYEYFSDINRYNGLSSSAHVAIARFLGAAHTKMLEWLQKAQTNRSAEELLSYWHNLMEDSAVRTERENFFRDVVSLANSMPTPKRATPKSPQRQPDLEADIPSFTIDDYSDEYYHSYAKAATVKLAAFASGLTPQRPMVVTYFDEAHALGESLWSLLRLLSKQEVTTSMWYVFLDTKSTISYFNPAPANRRSKQLRKEGIRLLPPYIAVGFDQFAIFDDRNGVGVEMGELQSVKHLASYGRPLWYAQYHEGEDDEQIRLAADKLICKDFLEFDPTDRHQVLAVLSQRVCVDTVLFSSDALELAERSVASHMRLLTGFAPDQLTFSTYSPSEPMLALAAALLLYKSNDVLGNVLDTFSKNLCEAGVIEKGLVGELAGRTLLTVARDLAAPKNSNGYSPNLLTPVLLMRFLDKLFGNELWCEPHRNEFQKAFKDTYVNFTHWIVTKDSLPEKPSQKLLANLWARGAALQCCFNHESLDLQIVTYKGSIAPDATFDTKKLSFAIFQIKNKSSADTKALRPIGLPRDNRRSLPYLAVVMELGNESNYRQPTGPIQVTPSPKVTGAFKALRAAWNAASRALKEEKAKEQKKKAREKGQGKGQKDPETAKLLHNVKTTRAAMDAYNRYSINVRGASPTAYGCLNEANIVTQFATLMKVSMPSPTSQEDTLRHMRPLERLKKRSAYTAWMTNYREETGSSDENGDDSSDDSDGNKDESDDDEDDPMDEGVEK